MKLNVYCGEVCVKRRETRCEVGAPPGRRASVAIVACVWGSIDKSLIVSQRNKCWGLLIPKAFPEI